MRVFGRAQPLAGKVPAREKKNRTLKHAQNSILNKRNRDAEFAAAGFFLSFFPGRGMIRGPLTTRQGSHVSAWSLSLPQTGGGKSIVGRPATRMDLNGLVLVSRQVAFDSGPANGTVGQVRGREYLRVPSG